MKTYQGGCHCGQVRYEVSTDLARVIECNCTICSKHGLLLTFVPAEQFKKISGEPKEYLFYKQKIHHLFCTACGVESYAHADGRDGKLAYAINVRCLEGVDLTAVTRTPFDGKSL
jgi:hypothetical protein